MASLVPAGVALAGTRVQRGTLLRRDYVMLPGLAIVVTAIGLGLEWLDGHRSALVGGAGSAAFLGLSLGRVVWRAAR